MRNIISILVAVVLGLGVVGSGSSAQAATTSEAATEAPSVATTKPSVQTRPAPSRPAGDTSGYAAREQKAGELENFRGGSASIYIGGSALTVALIIILVLIIL